MGEKYKIGDFGEFKFIEEYQNGKIQMKEWGMYGTIIKLEENSLVILGNDLDLHTVKIENLKKYKQHRPGVDVADFIPRLRKVTQFIINNNINL